MQDASTTEVSQRTSGRRPGHALLRRLLKLHVSATALLLTAAVLAVGAGAAVGTVLGGSIEGAIPITVSQALVADKPTPKDFPPNRSFFGSTSDDRTKFSFALEMYRGEQLTVLVPIINRSSGDTVAELTIDAPDIPSLVEDVPGLTVSVTGSGRVNDVVRVSPDTWTFTADGGLLGSGVIPPQAPDGVLITFSVAPTSIVGFFEITGRIRTLEF